MYTYLQNNIYIPMDMHEYNKNTRVSNNILLRLLGAVEVCTNHTFSSFLSKNGQVNFQMENYNFR